MGRPLVVTDGNDPMTRAILDYLDRMYGIPAQHVKSLNLSSQHGDVQMLTVTLMVQEETERPLRTSEIINGSEPPTERIHRA